jgi:hypothetical protein
MKYALREGRQGLPPQGIGRIPKRVVLEGPPCRADLPIGEVDARLLASALDELAREVLVDNRPLDEAWETLREQVLSGKAPRRRPTAERVKAPDSGGRLNCWECLGCGREPGGRHAAELGVCPAAVAVEADGVNGGRNGGRICWVVAGTRGKGPPDGTFARGHGACERCTFFRQVKDDAATADSRYPSSG